MLKCRGVHLIFSSGMENRTFAPNMWQVVFAHIPVKGRVINSDVNGFFDGSGHATSLPSYNLEVFY